MKEKSLNIRITRREGRVLKLLLQTTIVFFFSSMIIMLYSCHMGEEDEYLNNIKSQKNTLMQAIREEKLRRMQQTMFVNNKRPPDQVYNINVTLSEMIPLDREIQDTRPDVCQAVQYDTSRLPTVSVITVFYNEALSMLLRTVHSVLKRTPPELLVDVILVNDHSLNLDLGKKLEAYVELLPDKVRLLKTKKREGLIRARMLGASYAQGEVIMFQDAHTEANVGWAEPLLEEIQKDKRTIIQPEVEVIDQWNLDYYKSSSTVPRGGWTWDLRYVWMEVPQHEKDRLKEEARMLDKDMRTLPFRASALVGCALAVNKQHFMDIGAFDQGMNVWGGENIELAFRNWMCGGRVITHPCSRVAHVFKPFSYTFDGDQDKIVEKNLIRIAELWMGDYKRFFLASTWNWPTKRTKFLPHEIESLNERKQLRRRLGCKSFDWYLKTISPEIPKPPLEATYYGEVTNLKTERCWMATNDDFLSLTTFCFFHRLLPANVFWIDQEGRMHHNGKCLYVSMTYDLIKLGECTNDLEQDRWSVMSTKEVEGKIKVHITRNGRVYEMCVAQVSNVVPVHKDEQMVQALKCEDSHRFQHWRFHYKFDHSYDFGPLS